MNLSIKDGFKLGIGIMLANLAAAVVVGTLGLGVLILVGKAVKDTLPVELQLLTP
jgi:bifunctional ADP-heptose synthase (sugar kinase/adenylyltransferase)